MGKINFPSGISGKVNFLSSDAVQIVDGVDRAEMSLNGFEPGYGFAFARHASPSSRQGLRATSFGCAERPPKAAKPPLAAGAIDSVVSASGADPSTVEREAGHVGLLERGSVFAGQNPCSGKGHS